MAQSALVAFNRTIILGAWEFWLEENPRGVFLSVPDCGGMVDMLPRVPEQLEWAEEAFAQLRALERIWATTWKLPPEAVPHVEALFRRYGGQW